MLHYYIMLLCYYNYCAVATAKLILGAEMPLNLMKVTGYFAMTIFEESSYTEWLPREPLLPCDVN